MSDRPGLCRIHKDVVFGYRKHKEVNDIRMYIKDVLTQGSVLGAGCIVKLISAALHPTAA